MTWLEFVPSLLVAAAILFLPGVAVLYAGGMRGFFALAAAPVVSVGLVAGSAILAAFANQPFSLLPPIALTLVATLVAWVYARFRHHAPQPATPFPAAGWAWWASVAISMLLWARHLHNVLVRPDSFSQTFDNVWHLNAIHHIVKTGNGSSLSIANLNSPGGGFYPSAFHDVAALVTQYNGGNLLAAVNAVAAIICALVWPLAAMFLVRSIFKPHPAVAVSIGVLAASFPGFPLLLLDFGILYANLLGLAILPVALGVAIQATRLGRDHWIDGSNAVMIILVAIPSLMLSHPNAFMTFLLVSSVLALTVGISQIRKLCSVRDRKAIVRLCACMAVIGVTGVLWRFLRPGTSVNDWPAPLSTPAALGHGLLNAPLGLMANWTVSILMIVGVLIAARRGLGWLVGAWALILFFWIVVASFGSTKFRLLLVGIWYNDSSRFAANLPLLALPLAAFGLDWIVRQTQIWIYARRAVPQGFRPRMVTGILIVLLPLGLAVGTQRTTSMNTAVHRAWQVYQLTDSSPLITRDEYRLIMRLPTLVPPGATIANNPWNGSALAYALADRAVTAPHILYAMTPLRSVVRDRLDEATTDPAVCSLLTPAHVRYVLDLGSMGPMGVAWPYEGFDHLKTAPGFREIAHEGDARLYEITACR